VPGFTLFAFLWCAAILFHQLYQGRFALLDGTAALTLAALWALLRPASPTRLAVLLAVQVVVVGAEMPRVSNHWLLAGITSLGLLLALAPSLLRGRRPDAATLDAALGSVRVQILLLYALVTLAKLNSGFLDPVGSCGAEHYRRLAGSLAPLPTAPWAIGSAIAGTLLIEGSLPLLLFLRRTRPLAMGAGWVFHGMLGFNGYWDFSSVAAAYYAAFASAGLLAGGRAAVEHRPGLARAWALAGRASRSPAALPLAVLAWLLAVGLAALSGLPERRLVLAENHAGRWVWLAAWTLLGAALLAAARAASPAPEAPAARAAWWRRPLLWLAPLLVLLNGLCPYLGLKTENSYTMFSNLRTEGGAWNHYLVPRQLRVFGFQDHPLRILASNDPYLQRLARGGYSLVPFELRRYAAEHPDAALEYEGAGGRFRARRAADDPRLARPPQPLLAKLLLFRPVPPPERNECLH
jgi:hypothetical protein